MRLTYLLDEYQKYDGCVPITLNSRIYYLPPPEIAAAFMDDVVSECVQLLAQIDTSARLDDAGSFYVKFIPRGSNRTHKLPVQGTISVLELLEMMQGVGYDIPQNYWSRHRDQLKKIVNRGY